ncbi:Uncharacterized protein DAT39_006558, partial [Clarias magur]
GADTHTAEFRRDTSISHLRMGKFFCERLLTNYKWNCSRNNNYTEFKRFHWTDCGVLPDSPHFGLSIHNMYCHYVEKSCTYSSCPTPEGQRVQQS